VMTETEILLKNQLSEVLIQLDKLVELNKRQSLIIEKQQHQIDQLLRQLYGKKSENIPAQPSLFDQSLFAEGDIETVDAKQKETVVAEHKRRERKKDPSSLRYEFPEHLRREELVIEPTEVPDGAVKSEKR